MSEDIPRFLHHNLKTYSRSRTPTNGERSGKPTLRASSSSEEEDDNEDNTDTGSKFDVWDQIVSLQKPSPASTDVVMNKTGKRQSLKSTEITPSERSAFTPSVPASKRSGSKSTPEKKVNVQQRVTRLRSSPSDASSSVTIKQQPVKKYNTRKTTDATKSNVLESVKKIGRSKSPASSTAPDGTEVKEIEIDTPKKQLPATTNTDYSTDATSQPCRRSSRVNRSLSSNVKVKSDTNVSIATRGKHSRNSVSCDNLDLKQSKTKERTKRKRKSDSLINPDNDLQNPVIDFKEKDIDIVNKHDIANGFKTGNSNEKTNGDSHEITKDLDIVGSHEKTNDLDIVASHEMTKDLDIVASNEIINEEKPLVSQGKQWENDSEISFTITRSLTQDDIVLNPSLKTEDHDLKFIEQSSDKSDANLDEQSLLEHVPSIYEDTNITTNDNDIKIHNSLEIHHAKLENDLDKKTTNDPVEENTSWIDKGLSFNETRDPETTDRLGAETLGIDDQVLDKTLSEAINSFSTETETGNVSEKSISEHTNNRAVECKLENEISNMTTTAVDINSSGAENISGNDQISDKTISEATNILSTEIESYAVPERTIPEATNNHGAEYVSVIETSENTSPDVTDIPGAENNSEMDTDMSVPHTTDNPGEGNSIYLYDKSIPDTMNNVDTENKATDNPGTEEIEVLPSSESTNNHSAATTDQDSEMIIPAASNLNDECIALRHNSEDPTETLVTEDAIKQETKTVGITPKKRKGRHPRVKQDTPTITDTSGSKTPKTAPSKDKPTPADPQTTPATKRKKGRPPKLKTEENSADTSKSVGDSETSKTPHSVKSDATSPPSNEYNKSSTKRKQNKPHQLKPAENKTHMLATPTATSADNSSSIKKKRGRPPKRKDVPMPSNLSAPDAINKERNTTLANVSGVLSPDKESCNASKATRPSKIKTEEAQVAASSLASNVSIALKGYKIPKARKQEPVPLSTTSDSNVTTPSLLDYLNTQIEELQSELSISIQEKEHTELSGDKATHADVKPYNMQLPENTSNVSESPNSSGNLYHAQLVSNDMQMETKALPNIHSVDLKSSELNNYHGNYHSIESNDYSAPQSIELSDFSAPQSSQLSDYSKPPRSTSNDSSTSKSNDSIPFPGIDFEELIDQQTKNTETETESEVNNQSKQQQEDGDGLTSAAVKKRKVSTEAPVGIKRSRKSIDGEEREDRTRQTTARRRSRSVNYNEQDDSETDYMVDTIIDDSIQAEKTEKALKVKQLETRGVKRKGRPPSIIEPRGIVADDTTNNTAVCDEHDVNNEDEVVPVKKGRGRPRKTDRWTDVKDTPIQAIDDEHGRERRKPRDIEPRPKQVTLLKGKKLKAKRQLNSGSEPDDKVYKCPHCKKENKGDRKFGKLGTYRYHLMTTHALFPTKENPDGEASGYAYKMILNRVNKLHCPNPGCSFKSNGIQYFRFHLVWCGREAEMSECTVCGGRYRSMWLDQHMKDSHSGKPKKHVVEEDATEEEVKEEVPVEYTVTGSVRRKAAKRAIDNLQDLVSNICPNDYDKEDKKIFQAKKRKAIAKLYTEPTETIEVSSAMLKEWREEMIATQKAVCRNKGCEETYITIPGIKYHFEKGCKFKPDVQKFNCLVCNKFFASYKNVKTHILQMHSKDVNKLMQKLPANDDDDDDDQDRNPDNMEFAAGTESEEQEDDLSSGDEEKSLSSEDSDAYDSKSRFSSSKIKAYKCKDGVVRITNKKELRDYHVRLSKGTTLPHWMPDVSLWMRISEGIVNSYLPLAKISPSFKISYNKKISDSAHRLELFSSYTQGHVTYIYAGGPIWTADWCPTPYSTRSSRQYVALTCHSDGDNLHLPSETYTEPGLIQLWDFGALTNNGAVSTAPKMAVGLAHEYGAVWDLKWCPLGTSWQDDDNATGEIRRLGLLAVASSDGKVRILSIPQPSSVTGLSESLPVVRIREAAILVSQCSVAGGLPSQCYCVDWNPSDPTLLAAGYGDGTVAIWNLESVSTLLTVKTSSATRPYQLVAQQQFFAHMSHVKSIAWCPQSTRHLVSSGFEGSRKVWDLDDTSCELHEITSKKNLVVDFQHKVMWPHPGHHFLGSTPNPGSSCHVTMQPIGYLTKESYPLCRTTALVWDSSHSDWCNFHVMSTVSGTIESEIVLSESPDFMHNMIGKHTQTGLFLHVSDTSLEARNNDRPATSDTNIETALDNQQSAKETPVIDMNGEQSSHDISENTNIPTTVEALDNEPLTHHQAAEETCIVYNEEKLKFLPSQKSNTCKPEERSNHFPIQAIYKVAMNPNFASRAWMFSGGQAGIGRLHFIQGLADVIYDS